ncbi:MAG: phage terminase large subunit family protein [Pseudomonadota bacterium]
MGNMADGLTAYLAGYSRGLQPDPSMFVDEWADEYMRIPRGNGAEHGKYHTSRTPYAREPMRCLSDSHPARRVVAMVASQLFKTQVGLNWIGASIHQSPGNMLALLPTSSLAKRVSSRIEKTIQEVPELRARVAPPRSRDSRNTVDTKEFEGGTLYITTAGSAANLSEVPARRVYGDEVDRWEISVGGEGSPIELAETRASTFGRNAKFYYTSSPTEEGASAIADLFQQSDQRHYYVPCPHCGEHHILEMENMRWEEDFSSAWMCCPKCGCVIEESSKTEMLDAAQWIAHAKGDGETVGFTLSSLYASIGLGPSWASLARQYVRAKAAQERGDTEPMQVYYNTRLAKTWDNVSERIKSDHVKALAEPYKLGTVPLGALILTAAVDTQNNRLECKIIGWGQGLERWIVNYHVIHGSPADVSTWDELDAILKTPIQHAGGMPLTIRAVGIDTGGGFTQEVYDFCRLRRRRLVNGVEQRVLAIKGASKPGRPIVSSRPSKVDIKLNGVIEKFGGELWMIGTDTAKDWIHNRMLLTSGQGAIHYSADLPEEYYVQLVSEHKKTRYVKGFKRVEWYKSKADRNEALDLMVYNLAMAHHLELNRKPEPWWERLRLEVCPLVMDMFQERPEADAPEEKKEAPRVVVQAAAPDQQKQETQGRRVGRSAYLR